MKKLIYSALIGSLALAFTAQAADEKRPQKRSGHAGRGSANVQRAGIRSGGAGQARIHRSSNATNVQRRAVNPTRNNSAIVRGNRVHNSTASSLRQNNARRNGAQQSAAIRNASLARSKRTAVASQQNVVTNGSQNVGANRQANFRGNRNRNRNVSITNNWRGSRFQGQQYAAFRNYHRQRHDRNWYHSRYNRIVLFGGGNYYWDNGYWYPAWGYNYGYNYSYDGPIYGYNDLAPGDVVTNVQVQLQQQGYYEGAIDGLLGPMTRRAIAAFQAEHGLAITSAVDQPTLATLGLV